jgi:hypothetical protein
MIPAYRRLACPGALESLRLVHSYGKEVAMEQEGDLFRLAHESQYFLFDKSGMACIRVEAPSGQEPGRDRLRASATPPRTAVSCSACPEID